MSQTRQATILFGTIVNLHSESLVTERVVEYIIAL